MNMLVFFIIKLSGFNYALNFNSLPILYKQSYGILYLLLNFKMRDINNWYSSSVYDNIVLKYIHHLVL